MPASTRELRDRVGVQLLERETGDEVVEVAHLRVVLRVERDDLGQRHRRVQDHVRHPGLPERPVPVGVLVHRRERGHRRDVHVDEHPVAALR